MTRQEWLDSLKPGDEVATWDKIHRIVTRTRARIALDDGSTYHADGWETGNKRNPHSLRPAAEWRRMRALEIIDRHFRAMRSDNKAADSVVLHFARILESPDPAQAVEDIRESLLLRAGHRDERGDGAEWDRVTTRLRALTGEGT